jgi:hypothetical protein
MQQETSAAKLFCKFFLIKQKKTSSLMPPNHRNAEVVKVAQ